MGKLLTSIFFIIPAMAAGQVAADSVGTEVELQEVVVAAPTVIHKADKDLYIPKAEFTTTAALTYTWRDFQFAAGMMMPFGKYNQGSELLNRYNSNVQTIQSHFVSRMPFLKVSYNLSWGKQKRGADRLIDDGSSVQQSKAAGR